MRIHLPEILTLQYKVAFLLEELNRNDVPKATIRANEIKELLRKYWNSIQEDLQNT